MSPTLIIFPVVVQVALTFALLVWTGRSRMAALKGGAVRVKDIALGQRAWPDRVQQISNCYHSQFEVPVLFFVLAGLVIATRQLDILQLALAWLFVALRFGHALVHTTSNHVPTRFNVFAAGVFVLMAMWILFAVRFVAATA
jgi:hypothetical protein